MHTIRQKGYDLLRWSEQYTKTDMLYVARGGFWITLGQAAASVFSLVLVIAFANLLPKETYGLYRYILSIAGVLNIFTLMGMNSAVSRAVAAGYEGAFRSSIRYQFKWNLLMLAAFWTLGGYYYVQENMILAASFALLGLFVPPTLALNTYGAYLEGKREFRLSSIFGIASTSVYTLGVLVALVLGGGVVWLIFAYAAATFSATLLFYVITVRTFKPPLSAERDTLQYGRNLTLIGFLEPVAAQLDKILLAHFWGATQLAVYTLAAAIPNRAMSFMKSWVTLGFPKFSSKTAQENDVMFYRRIFQGLALGAIAAGAYIALAPFVFKYLLPQYMESILYSQILVLFLIFAMPNRYISLLLVSQKKPRVIFINNVIQVSVRIALYVLLGIWGGLMGLISANVIAAGVGMLINMIMWRRAIAGD